MKLTAGETLTVDGVALGATRAEVDALLGTATTNANPAWARYFGPNSSGERRPLLVGYRPNRALAETRHWRADSLCGSVLRGGPTVLAQVGESHQTVKSRLGPPEAAVASEPGYGCLIYEGCLVTFCEHSGRVVEVCLRSAISTRADEGETRTLSFDSALAC